MITGLRAADKPSVIERPDIRSCYNNLGYLRYLESSMELAL